MRVGVFVRRAGAAVRQFRDAFTVSLFPASEIEARIVDRQLDILRANTRLVPYAIPAAGAVGAFAVAKWVSPLVLCVWLALLVVAAASHEMAARHFDKHQSAGVADVQRRAMAMTLLCVFYLLVWSSFGVWAWSPDIAVSHYLVAFVLGCTLAAACTMGSVHTATVVGVAVPAALLMMFRPLLSDALDPMTGICVVYVVLMAAFARTTHVTTTRALQLEDDRAELIGRLQRARDESDAARKRAEEANLAKSEFLANMSHELRTPLNAIIGFSDIIRTRAFGPARDKYAEYAGFINESGTHLLALISDMLELAKIEAGRKTLREDELDLSEVIASVVEEVREVARDREVTIEIARGPAPLLFGDRYAVHHILHQLVSNAVKFTRPQGHVKADARLTERGEVAIVVADDGVGIGAEEQAHVFDRFGRGKHDIARANTGSGLGLPIVKGLVELHGGRIELVSAPGEGTRVSVIFPASRTVGAPLMQAVAS
jgi:two-component system cell cycle sensor histidine kinase PleC